jgi:hypothetical protein
LKAREFQQLGVEEFCGDSRLRLSGRASGGVFPLHLEFNPAMTY